MVKDEETPPEQCAYLVTGREGAVKRTAKLLRALAAHGESAPAVVTDAWLDAVVAQQEVVEPTTFAPSTDASTFRNPFAKLGPKSSKRSASTFGSGGDGLVSLAESLERRRRLSKPLLEGVTMVMHPDLVATLGPVAQAAGADVLKWSSAATIRSVDKKACLVLVGNEDADDLIKAAKKKDVSVYKKVWLHETLLRQHVDVGDDVVVVESGGFAPESM